MSQESRKRIELKRKIQSLADEFEQWKKESEAGESLEKHHTQIRRITSQLQAAHNSVDADLESSFQAGNLLDESAEIEKQVLEVHRIWGFFRDKFALRHMDWFLPFLAVADEFAWHCYRPACEKAIQTDTVKPEAVKEPPLLFFTGSSTPFAMSRNASYRSEIPPENGLGIQSFAGLLKSLPISVIGLPWFQLAHLPDAVVIGHEAGHNVEDDLGLTERLRTRLITCLQDAQVPEDRQEAWQSWLGEMFADIYGTLATGPAYAGAQADFLSDAATDIMTEDPRAYGDWGYYPTTYIRMLIVYEVLDYLNYGDEVTRRREAWIGKYDHHALTEFESDIPFVVRAIVEGEFLGDEVLTKTLVFSKIQFDKAKKDAINVLQGYEPEGTRVRSLLATARLAFEQDPENFFASDVQTIILNRILKSIKTGTRSGVRSSNEHEQKLIASDLANGQRLLDQIKELK